MGEGSNSDLSGLALREALASPVRAEVVDHPAHYNAFGPIEEDGTAKFEPIKVIEAWGLGPEFCIENALKYIARAPHKGRPIEDLKKAKWYLDRAASRIDGSETRASSPTGPMGWGGVG